MSTWIDYNPLFCFVLFYNYVCLTHTSYHPAKASPAHQKVFILAMKSTSESRIRARNSCWINVMRRLVKRRYRGLLLNGHDDYRGIPAPMVQ